VFQVEESERVDILKRAVSDINLALTIPFTPDAETDLNLFNSLAHAYHDLADEEAEAGNSSDRIAELRTLARNATQRAFRADPDNSFVIETYARNLLSDAQSSPDRAAENALEVLNIVYAALERDRSSQRRSQLSKLADSALKVLIEQSMHWTSVEEPNSEIE